MTGGRSAWRADDVVAYDAMREEANSAIALLLRLSDSRAIKADQAVSEAIDIREMMSDIDGYDRAAVDSARARLADRVTELTDKQR